MVVYPDGKVFVVSRLMVHGVASILLLISDVSTLLVTIVMSLPPVFILVSPIIVFSAVSLLIVIGQIYIGSVISVLCAKTFFYNIGHVLYTHVMWGSYSLHVLQTRAQLGFTFTGMILNKRLFLYFHY